MIERRNRATREYHARWVDNDGNASGAFHGHAAPSLSLSGNQFTHASFRTNLSGLQRHTWLTEQGWALWTRNSAVANKSRYAFVQIQWRGWPPKTPLPNMLPRPIWQFCEKGWLRVFAYYKYAENPQNWGGPLGTRRFACMADRLKTPLPICVA